MRRTSETGRLVGAPRMRTLRGPSRTLKSLHRTTSSSDVPFVTRRHTRVGIRIRPICCPVSRPPCGGDVMRSLPASQRTLRRPAGESKTGKSPRTPSIVSRTCKPKPASHAQEVFLGDPAHAHRFAFFRIRAPASDGATDLFPASALRHQQALRPPGVKDARCVEPMSATHTNYVHPHLARSRFALATFAAGTPHGVLGSVRHDQGSGRFHDVRGTASADRHAARFLVVLALRWSHERGRVVPTALMRSSL